MRYQDGLHLIPQHMHGGVERYVEKGIPPGGFLEALLANDFMEAMGRADAENQEAIQGWAQFIYNWLPNGCWGSPRAVREWISMGGLQGMQETA